MTWRTDATQSRPYLGALSRSTSATLSANGGSESPSLPKNKEQRTKRARPYPRTKNKEQRTYPYPYPYPYPSIPSLPALPDLLVRGDEKDVELLALRDPLGFFKAGGHQRG